MRSSRSSKPRYVSRIGCVLSSLLRTLQHKQGNKKAEEDASKDAETKVKEIEAAGRKSGDKVVEDLMRAITDVKPEVPDKISVKS